MTGGAEQSTFPYNGVEWYLDHHETKAAERRQMVADLGLPQGAHVLDIGCGPGLWAPMFAERVGPGGQIVELDLSLPYIRYGASGLVNGPLSGLVSFAVGSFFALPFPDDAFDIAFVANSLSRHSNALEVILEMARVTRPGGRVISKEFDDGTFVFHPVSTRLGASVLQGVTTALEASVASGSTDTSWPRYDGFMGRKVRGLLVQAGLDQITSRAYAIHKAYPLDESAKRYIQGNATFLGETAGPYLNEPERRAWRAAFDPLSDDYVLDSPDFFFCLTEVVAAGTVVHDVRPKDGVT